MIAFAANGTENPDAFIVTSISRRKRQIAVTLNGCKAHTFEAFRTTKSPDAKDLDQIDEAYAPLGEFQVHDGTVVFEAPAGSVTTFYAK